MSQMTPTGSSKTVTDQELASVDPRAWTPDHLDDSEPPVDYWGSLQRLMGAPAEPPRTPPRAAAIPGSPTLDAESPAASFDDAFQVAMGGGGVQTLLSIFGIQNH